MGVEATYGGSSTASSGTLGTSGLERTTCQRLKMEMSAETTYGGSGTASRGTLGASGLERRMCQIAVQNGNECGGDIRGKWYRKWRNIGCSESRAMCQIEVVSTNVGVGHTQSELQAADGQSPEGRVAAVLHN